MGEYVCDAEGGRHQAFYSPVRDTIVMGERVQPHERIKVEQSLKYSTEEAGVLWKQAGMASLREWRHREHYGESRSGAKTPCFLLCTIRGHDHGDFAFPNAPAGSHALPPPLSAHNHVFHGLLLLFPRSPVSRVCQMHPTFLKPVGRHPLCSLTRRRSRNGLSATRVVGSGLRGVTSLRAKTPAHSTLLRKLLIF